MDNQQHTRLAEARMKAGFRSAKEAADTFHWSYSTYASHENAQRGLRIAAARRYARAFNVSVDWLLFGKTDGTESFGGFIPVATRAATGVWLEVLGTFEYDDDTLIPPLFLKNHANARQFAIKIEGPGANKVLPDGSYAIAAAVDTYRPPQDGDLVFFRRDRDIMMELTIKRYSRQGDKVFLIPETDESRMQQPIEFREIDETGALNMQILAIIIGAVLIF